MTADRTIDAIVFFMFCDLLSQVIRYYVTMPRNPFSALREQAICILPSYASKDGNIYVGLLPAMRTCTLFYQKNTAEAKDTTRV